MKDTVGRLVTPLIFGGFGVIMLSGVWQALVFALGLFRVRLPNRWTFWVFVAGWMLVAVGIGVALLTK